MVQQACIHKTSKDLIDVSAASGGSSLLGALTYFLNLILQGKTPDAVCPFFFLASFVALNKTDGGVRSIAIGNAMRRLAAKCVGNSFKQLIGLLLASYQLGYGSYGADAIAHATRVYLESLQPDQVIVKLDFSNVFNFIRRDKMFAAVDQLAPKILPPFVHSAYCSSFPYSLVRMFHRLLGIFIREILWDLSYFASVHDLMLQLKSEFRAFYLDGGILGGFVEEVLHDL